MKRSERRRTFPGRRAPVALLALVVAIQGLALWGLWSAGDEARRAARADLELQATAQARAFESALSTRRNDLLFLTQSSPLKDGSLALLDPNPVTSRWRRLDFESTVILFLAAHPEIESLELRAADGSTFLLAGRRDGAPVLLPMGAPRSLTQDAEAGPGARDPSRALLSGSWPLGVEGSGGALRVVLDPATLLSIASPNEPARLLQGAASMERTPSNAAAVNVPVTTDGWDPPSPWTLTREERRSGLTASIGALTDRFRTTLIVNLVLMALVVVLGSMALTQIRARALAEAERREETRRRELEAQLLHTERLASVGRLAAGMAHEINNPLEGMSNYLALLEDDLRQGRVPEALEMAGRVRHGLERAAGITRQVLAYADPGRAPVGPVELRTVVEEAAEFLRANQAYRTAIRVHAGAAVVIPGNRVMLGQLFLNLLLNAAEIQERAGEIEVELETAGEEAVIRVADRGPGVPEAQRLKIFEPFYSSRGSTGLGLAICAGIVRDHRGRIDVDARDGGGATFTVRLPLVENRQS